jgi:antitoxin ParD1/3/4
MATMNVSLPDAMKEWVEQQVASGRYANASDLVRDLVRREQERAEARENLQKMVDDALASGTTLYASKEDLLEKVMSKAEAALRERKSA